MSTSRITVTVPARVAAPRGSIWAAEAAVRSSTVLRSIGRSIWDALESFGQRRAMHEMHALAERWQVTDPELARCLREALRDPHGHREGSTP